MSKGPPRTKIGREIIQGPVQVRFDERPVTIGQSAVLAIEAEMRAATLAEVLDEVERAITERMHGGVWMSEERVLAIIAELRKEKP